MQILLFFMLLYRNYFLILLCLFMMLLIFIHSKLLYLILPFSKLFFRVWWLFIFDFLIIFMYQLNQYYQFRLFKFSFCFKFNCLLLFLLHFLTYPNRFISELLGHLHHFKSFFFFKNFYSSSNINP